MTGNASDQHRPTRQGPGTMVPDDGRRIPVQGRSAVTVLGAEPNASRFQRYSGVLSWQVTNDHRVSLRLVTTTEHEAIGVTVFDAVRNLRQQLEQRHQLLMIQGVRRDAVADSTAIPGLYVRLLRPGTPRERCPRTELFAPEEDTSALSYLAQHDKYVRNWEHSLHDAAPSEPPTFYDRAYASMLAGACGDALGAPVEFERLDSIRNQYGTGGICDFGPAGLTASGPTPGSDGTITDDTQMTLFTLEGLLFAHEAGRGGDPVGAVHQAYLRWLGTQGPAVDSVSRDRGLVTLSELHTERSPDQTCLRALLATAHGEPLGSRTNQLNDSQGCGGVVRVAPVGMWPGEDAELFRAGVEIAALTHGHPGGYLPAGTLALLVGRLLRGDDLISAIHVARGHLLTWPAHEETLAALDAGVDLGVTQIERLEPDTLEQRLGAGWTGPEALAIGVCAVIAGDGVPEALRMAVNHSGDSDSTGAIAGYIAGADRGTGALPRHWPDGVELSGVIQQVTYSALTEFATG